jgi:hypothetical protein
MPKFLVVFEKRVNFPVAWQQFLQTCLHAAIVTTLACARAAKGFAASA